MPNQALLKVRSEAPDIESHRSEDGAPTHGRSRIGCVLRSRWLAWVTALLVSAAVVGIAGFRLADSARRVDSLTARLRAAESQIRSAGQTVAAASDQVAAAQARASALQKHLDALRAAKTRTVVETRTVTKSVTRWIPNGKGITVDVTGFEGRIQIHDVQLTHAFGYTDLIGIAVNKSAQTISYAQLGCSFLGPDGRLLAAGMDNKQNWQPGQSWGFDCSGQVNATGGILRVDELS
jgi:hypothetical protein